MTRRVGTFANKLVYGMFIAAFAALAYVYGAPGFYLAAYSLAALPFFSIAYMLVFLRGLRVEQNLAQGARVKLEWCVFNVTIDNSTPLPLSGVRCVFAWERSALEINRDQAALFVAPFMKKTVAVDFRARYRGEYAIGVESVEVTDLLGLFVLRKKLGGSFAFTSLPYVIELPGLTVASLLSQAHSNFDVRDEDYSSVADVRPYEINDSIKRVHWQLTAKRGQWLVKNFQSHALNSSSILFDDTRPPLGQEEAYALEDRVVEHTLSVVYYCLHRRMPVTLYAGKGLKAWGRTPGDFNALYHILARIRFDVADGTEGLGLSLDECVASQNGYANVIVAATKLDESIFNRIAKACASGHFIVVVYFPCDVPGLESERVFEKLIAGGFCAERAAVAYETG
ncbi:MAG: DUF58 domain-containing protein [Defluviitaleaceae bacterium]|nr:DUF58 domain-containing protein [Defluviitaleaceae bacterium]